MPFASVSKKTALSCPSRKEQLPTPAADARRTGRVALRWVSEPDRTEELTHAELLDQAARAAAALSRLGVRAGDRVAVYLPLVPESVIVTLACGRLDVVRCSLPVGLRAHELRSRIRETGAKVVITADGEQRCGEAQPLKQSVDRALTGCPEVRSLLVVHRLGRPVSWTPGRDLWWHDELGRYTEPLARPYS